MKRRRRRSGISVRGARAAIEIGDQLVNDDRCMRFIRADLAFACA